jgi:hypothetical protein
MAAFGKNDDEGLNPLPRATFRELARRVLVANARVRVDPAAEAWVRSVLTPPELDLWNRQSSYDRNHAVRVARRVERRLASTRYGRDTLWPGAALMHDVGKLQADLSPYGRVIAALASKVVSLAAARRWARSANGARRRIGLYLTHGEVGADMIRAAGGREEIAAWAQAHQGCHRIAGLGIPPLVLEALLEADVA